MESSCPNSSGLDHEAGWEPRPGLGGGEEAKAALAHWSGPKGRFHIPHPVCRCWNEPGLSWSQCHLPREFNLVMQLANWQPQLWKADWMRLRCSVYDVYSV